MNKKMCALLTLVVAIAFAAPFANAQTVPRVTTWTDKPRYGNGERGTLYIAFYNDRTEAIEVRNITVIYGNWHAYINQIWVGNETKKYSVTIASKAKNVFTDVTFTTPTDGRAVDTWVSIEIGTDHGYESATAYIHFYESSRYMDQIVMLFTVLVVLVIVCTAIIAAAVFLSARRPQVMWSKEDKS